MVFYDIIDVFIHTSPQIIEWLCVCASQVLLVDVCRCHVLKLSSQPLMQAAVAAAMKPKNKFNFSHLEALHSNHCATRFMKHSWSSIYSAGKISTARLSEKSLAVVELALECHPSPQEGSPRQMGNHGEPDGEEPSQALKNDKSWVFESSIDVSRSTTNAGSLTYKAEGWRRHVKQSHGNAMKCRMLQDGHCISTQAWARRSRIATSCDVGTGTGAAKGPILCELLDEKAHELLQDGCLWMDADQSSIYGNLCSARSYATSYPTSGTADPVHPERLPFHVITASSWCRLTWWFMMNIWISGFQVWASWLIWRIQAVSSSFKQL